ncbi:MAG: 50S ribosomal protein L3 [Deltaproteobacteria bacterium]|nr:50S ribosomal protein L3 [Deltaproteobacteria bacterium]
MQAGILGLKAGMTQIYNKDGDAVPVTVIDLQPTVVTQVKNEARDGYVAVQVGFSPKKPQRTTKADKGHFKKSGAPGFYTVREYRVDSVDGIQEGALLLPDFVKEGDLVDVTAESKGKGFQGGMKRHNFSGGFKTHGASVCHRSLGSIGNRADPGRTFKNKKMAGHMGHEQVTIMNLRVISVDRENNLMLVKGSIPGPKNGVVSVRKAVKDNG